MGRIENNPCRHCAPPKRNEWCHSVCKEYADWRAEFTAQKQRVRNSRSADIVIMEGAKERKRRYLRGLRVDEGVRHK